MKKMLLLAAMAALAAMMLAAAPAMAQVNQEVGGDGSSAGFDRCFPFCEDRHDHFDRHDKDFVFDGTGVVQNVGGNESESGAVSLSFDVSNSGNNSNQCASALQFGNTGNNQSSQGVLQFRSESGDIEFEGGGFDFAPTNTQTCNQTIQQSAAAASGVEKARKFVSVEFVPVNKVEFVPVKQFKPAEAVAVTGGTAAKAGGGEAVAATGGTLATAKGGKAIATAGGAMATAGG